MSRSTKQRKQFAPTIGPAIRCGGAEKHGARWRVRLFDAAGRYRDEYFIDEPSVTAEEQARAYVDRFRTRAAERSVGIAVTEAPLEGGPGRLVYHPQAHVLGVGCARGAPAADLWDLAQAALAEAGIAPGAIAAVATLLATKHDSTHLTQWRSSTSA